MTEELNLTIDHITLSVEDIDRAKSFYEPTLAAIGLEIVGEFTGDDGERFIGFGIGRKGTFWIAETGRQTPSFHVAFRAKSRDAVVSFYESALAAGGSDNGEPGVREIYHPQYYAAFVHDPEGHNIEAVTFEP